MPRQLPDDVRFDIRLQRRNLARGVISREALQAHLQQIPDLEAQADVINIEQLAGTAVKIHGHRGTAG